jgi:transcription initiation factor TFIIIB Brf1 subunit/transcription initiation factor TFIIB
MLCRDRINYLNCPRCKGTTKHVRGTDITEHDWICMVCGLIATEQNKGENDENAKDKQEPLR